MKNTKIKITDLNKWYDYSHKIENSCITENLINLSFSIFSAHIVSSLSSYEPVKYPSQIKILILLYLFI